MHFVFRVGLALGRQASRRDRHLDSVIFPMFADVALERGRSARGAFWAREWPDSIYIVHVSFSLWQRETERESFVAFYL